MFCIFPDVFATTGAGGFSVVKTILAGIISGYLKNQLPVTRMATTTKTIVIPHRTIHLGGRLNISCTSVERSSILSSSILISLQLAVGSWQLAVGSWQLAVVST